MIPKKPLWLITMPQLNITGNSQDLILFRKEDIMATFKVSDVMERKVDGVIAGYIAVIECEGVGGAKVSNSVFIAKEKLLVTSSSSIATFATAWLKEKDGDVTRAEAMAIKAVNISDEQAKTLIPSSALSIGPI